MLLIKRSSNIFKIIKTSFTLIFSLATYKSIPIRRTTNNTILKMKVMLYLAAMWEVRLFYILLTIQFKQTIAFGHFLGLRLIVVVMPKI